MNKPVTFDQAQELNLPEIKVGFSYPFHSTSVADPDVTPHSGQMVTVVAHNPNPDAEDGREDTYKVKLVGDDDVTFDAFKGELDGWYYATGQYANHPSFSRAEV